MSRTAEQKARYSFRAVSPESEKFSVSADNVVIATGRKGADWLEDMCKKHNIEHLPGTVDIGVRVEVRNEVMEDVNEALYESKLIGYPEPFTNKVRTFCQNPGGFGQPGELRQQFAWPW